METPVILTERLELRPFQESDAEEVYHWCSSNKVTEYLFWYPHRDLEVSKRLLAAWTSKKRNLSWALSLKGQAIGEIQVIKDLPDNGKEMGYTLDEDYWGKGYMSEALTAAISYLSLHGAAYFYACTDARNEKSIRLLTKLGFIEQVRKPYHIDKKNQDIVLAEFVLRSQNPSCGVS